MENIKDRLRDLIKRRKSLDDLCFNLVQPGTGIGNSHLMDFSNGTPETPDQIRMEQVLESFKLEGTSILHVGIGSSRLAQRLSHLLHDIDGLTIDQNEKDYADALAIENYQAYLLSKYSPEIISCLKTEKYDFILDNNLTSFACCKYHFYLMMDSYIRSLKPGGRLLTDQQGMSWTFTKKRWRLNEADLVELGQHYGFEVSRMTDMVYALQKRS
jgi:hypothetical protein